MCIKNIRSFHIPGRWTVHSYYTLNPYAPDGSGRILCAGCDPDSGIGEVMILGPDGRVIDRFGRQKISTIFYHTGFWQSWSPDGRGVYFQSCDGDVLHPKVTLHDFADGKDYTIAADMEGTPVNSDWFLYGLSGMYYAAGYADGCYHPELSPIPFTARDRHGLFRTSVKEGKSELVISVEELLWLHPLRDRLLEADHKVDGGLTLMVYCARYDRSGTRVMFHFGNHCTDKRRGEPKVMSLFTADCDTDGNLSNLHCSLDMSFGGNGVHWSWDNDGSLIGYYKYNGKSVLAGIDADGGNLRVYSDNTPYGGHPSISPHDSRIIVSDAVSDGQGKVFFMQDGEIVDEVKLPKYDRSIGELPRGRNRYYVCHHPVFNADGTRVLCNTLPDRRAELCELEIEY